MGPFQLFNLNYTKHRYKTQSTVIGRKGADWHFARTFKNRKILSNDIIYCLNLGERNGRTSPEIPKPDKTTNLLISYKNLIKKHQKFK
jgi:hypothetical protein